MNKSNWKIVAIVFAFVLALTGCSARGTTIGALPEGTPAAIDTGESPTPAPYGCQVEIGGKTFLQKAGTTETYDIGGSSTFEVTVNNDCSATEVVGQPITPTSVPTADPVMTPTPTPTATPAPTDVPTQAPTVPPTPVPPVVIVVTATPTPFVPAIIDTPPTAPTGSGASCMSAGDLALLVDTASRSTSLLPPYALITMLDAHPAKQDHPIAGWTSTGANVVWTGSYIPDPSYGGQVVPVLVDGKTGTYLQLLGTSVTWQTAGGSIAICENGDLVDVLKQHFPSLFSATGSTPASTPAPTTSTTVPATAPTATGPICVDTAEIVGIINANKADPDAVFVHMDEIADGTPTARLRAEQPAKYDVVNSQAILWVKTGEISGSVLQLHQNDSKSLYMVTKDGEVNLSYPHSGLRLCEPLNPARDFPWWGE